MSFFHVRIARRSNYPDEVRLDLTREQINQRVVVPYNEGHSITIGSNTLSLRDIERITVNQTKSASIAYRGAARLDRELNPFNSFEWHLAAKGEDVTDEFITSPPGSGSKATHDSQEEVRPTVGTREVFVVHGRYNDANAALFEFLRSIDLHPLEWSEVASLTGRPSPYIGEILDAAFSHAHAVVVLLTPDDEARLRHPFRVENDPPHETQLTGQARPNVLFEAGMAMGRDENRTVLVELGTLRPFSDIAGRHVIRMDNSSQRRQDLAQRLEAAGCPVNLKGTAWHTAGDFEAAIASLDAEMANPVEDETQKTSIDGESQLSEDAKELLIEATKDRHGLILVARMNVGKIIQTHSKQFAKQGDRRSEARWEQAMGELIEYGFIQDPTGSGKSYEVTHLGFQAADELTKQG